jgi:hypothetical protein
MPAKRSAAMSHATNLFAQPEALTNYICHWSRIHGYVFVETPKVACTTIKRVLQAAELGPGRIAERPADVHDRGRSPLLSPCEDPGAFASAMQDPDVFRFAFVRNPFSRALSCWLDKMVKNAFERERLAPKLGFDPATPPAFGDFLTAVCDQEPAGRDIHWATQTYLLRPNRIRYSFIGRFEFFRPQFLAVCSRLGIDGHADDLPETSHATNAGSKIREYVGQREAAIIRHIYEDDFRNFGYGWDPAVI